MTTANSVNFFRDRTAVLATMHQKEQVIAPILAAVGVKILLPPDFNTDQFGTFTRDIDRPADQLHTARLKAEQALSLTSLTLAVASEGSFGPHPSFPFMACDREIVLLIDRSHDLEIIGEAVSLETNYAAQQVTTLAAALDFADKIGFPSHALVAMPEAASRSTKICKGITDETQLIEIVTWFLNQFGSVRLETDMRAMYNPTRMKVIAEATQVLLDRMQQTCPHCSAPGYAPFKKYPGLPCALCGFPTALTLSVMYRCQKCNFSSTTYFPDQPTADPSQCSYCNP